MSCHACQVSSNYYNGHEEDTLQERIPFITITTYKSTQLRIITFLFSIIPIKQKFTVDEFGFDSDRVLISI